MAKNLKLTIKNTQIADAINLGNLKNKLAKKKTTEPEPTPSTSQASSKSTPEEEGEEQAKLVKDESAPRVRARSRSAFAEPSSSDTKSSPESLEEEATPSVQEEKGEEESADDMSFNPSSVRVKTSEELRKGIFGEHEETAPSPIKEEVAVVESKPKVTPVLTPAPAPKEVEEVAVAPAKAEKPAEAPVAPKKEVEVREAPPIRRTLDRPTLHHRTGMPSQQREELFSKPKPYVHVTAPASDRPKLGPTGRHVNDLLPKKVEPKIVPKETVEEAKKPVDKGFKKEGAATTTTEEDAKHKNKFKRPGETSTAPAESADSSKKGIKSGTKEFRDIKPAKRVGGETKTFDARDRQGLGDKDDEPKWRRRKQKSAKIVQEDVTIRPTSLKIRTPILIKDLASEMKLKASQLITKLFLQGLTVTLNDALDDETTIQLLGQEFGCEITIDSTEEERIRITDKSVSEEISLTDPSLLVLRAPVVAFMGHVDHGKTSLIDAIRNSNRVSGEAGAITQHIGAFRCHTPIGDIAILDTPGHEAFSAMRARGADVTDIVVLVVAGDEGIRQQTVEAIQHAKDAKVTIVVAINKCDKPNFNPENVYRQLADNDLLPESWGGEILTVNCSAVTKEGIPKLLETLALQAEILELRSNPSARARGTVLESEMHKGMGSVATILVQNGTLRVGDSVVFDRLWGRIKTMQDEFGSQLQEAIPSTPVEITGLSGLPEAGQEFIVVKNEREAREIAEVRRQGIRQLGYVQRKKISAENIFLEASPSTKKVLNIVLRADVQGSLEALKVGLEKIQSTKAEINIVFAGVGEVSESDIQLASTSKGIVIGFHTQVESHAELLVKELGVKVRLHDIIYHAIDDVKAIMVSMLDKVAQETDKGKAEVRALFKSSQVGVIAGCIVIEGSIHRNHHVRVMRKGKLIGTTSISTLKRVKEDVREVLKGLECGIVFNRFYDIIEGDILEAYEITYITQEL